MSEKITSVMIPTVAIKGGVQELTDAGLDYEISNLGEYEVAIVRVDTVLDLVNLILNTSLGGCFAKAERVDREGNNVLFMLPPNLMEALSIRNRLGR